MCRGFKKGSKNPMWKGNKVSYRALHKWIKINKPKSEKCVSCGKKVKRLELSNISGENKRDIKDYEWLCVKCHRNKDLKQRMREGRFNKISKNNKSGMRGVCYCKRDKNWRAYITINKKQIFLRSSKDKNKVIKARKEAEKNMCMGIKGAIRE